MKIFVVLAGLMLIVPHADPATGQWTSLTVLVLETAHAGPQIGEQIRNHRMDVTNLGGAPPVPLAGRWAVRSNSSKPILVEDPVTVDGKGRLLFLRDLYSPEQLPSVRPACYGPDFDTACVLNGRKLLQAQITFHGGWIVRPIDINHDREPRAKLIDDSIWGFLRVRGNSLPLALKDQRQLAGGIVLEARDGASVAVEPPSGTFPPLQTIPAAGCDVLVGTQTSCAVIRFLNTVRPEIVSAERLEIDHHHNLLYDPFDPTPMKRYLLFLRKDGTKSIMDQLYPIEGGGSVGGIRPCMPGAFVDPVQDGLQ